VRIGVHLESQLSVLRFVPERSGDHFQQVGEEYFLSLD